jgi:leucyl/phenylalanyl-tRNA--protein transferase
VTVYRLSERFAFPHPDEAEDDGLLAVGGDLSPERLVLAYSAGIFPWQGDPPLWFSPDPRWVIEPARMRMDRSARRAVAGRRFQLEMDRDFPGVIRACAQMERPGQDGTWIDAEMQAAYKKLHELGFAHCVEAREGAELVGGVYGVSLGGAFFGESMFNRTSGASKLALLALLSQLRAWEFDFLDCQVHTGHVERLGAVAWPRKRFLAALAASMERPTRRGPWSFDPDPLAALHEQE